jgi:hypothetical protein
MTPIIRSKKGIILIASYLVIVILLIYSLIFVNRSISEKNITMRHKNLISIFYLAEAGLDRGLDWLRSQSSPPSGTLAFDPLGGSQSLGEGIYSVSIDPDDNNPGTTLKRYKIISTATIGDLTKQLINEVRVDSYARYTWFTDTEHFRWYGYRLPVWFVSGDHLEGPTQTNGHFHINEDPVFAGNVKSSDNFITFFNNGNNIDTTATSNPPYDVPDFQQGISLGVDQIDMPSKALDLRTAAVHDGLQLTGPTTIVLNSDGTMTVTNSHEKWTDENMALPINGALFVDGGDVNVSGVLNGRLSIGTNRNIVVVNNITYADDPRTHPASDDMLGLIAEKDVVISQNAPYNVEVDASMLALGNSFLVENWWGIPVKGTLTLYGGIIQRERGPVGTFSSSTGQKLSGYSKDYHYDTRLIDSPPPFYPTTGDYISLSWKEQ